MAPTESGQTVVVLDLDDTLYKEVEYQESGLLAVSELVSFLYGRNGLADMALLRQQGETDLLGGLCRLIGVPDSVKESLLWVYRLHCPRISLDETVSRAIKELATAFRVVILTDGRSVSQRLKLKALGLDYLPVYISEEYDSTKPDKKRFELIMREFSSTSYVYVADNPTKDFLAPNSLGWMTIGLRGDHRNVHSQNIQGLSLEQLPGRWISRIDELFGTLC